MEEISTNELFSLFVDTLDRCTIALLTQEDYIIEYDLFEEFDIGVHSFLHSDVLQKLLKQGYINDKVMELSLNLRRLVLGIGKEKWTAQHVKSDKEWYKILSLSDKIKKLL